MDYKHKVLSLDERDDFLNLYLDTLNKNMMMKLLDANKFFALTYPLILIVLTYLTVSYSVSNLIVVVGFMLGFLAIQLNFITAHTWAHALMLEYPMWKISEMTSKIGQLPIVMYYAFYHHHHTKTDIWGHNILKYDKVETLYSHWNSFSLFTCHYPINNVLMQLFLAYNLYFHFGYVLSFILGYEFGVFLLPISHDWVHERRCGDFGAYYLLRPLEYIGVFAAKHDHHTHHKYDHATVYQNFTSSGIYSKLFDKMLDKMWNKMFAYSVEHKVPLHNLMWYPMFGSMFLTVYCLPYVLTLM